MAQAIQLVDDVDTVRLKPDPQEDPSAEYHKREQQKKRIIQRKPIHTKEAIFFTSNHRIPFSSFFFVVLRLPLSLPSPVGLASAGRHGHTSSRRLCRYRQAEA
jgi:hypothetical protein